MTIKQKIEKPKLTNVYLPLLFSLNLSPQYALANYSFDQFKTDIIKAKTKTVASAIRMFPDEFKSNYTLMKNSHSLQQSSKLNPRVIMFGHTGETIYTFNGDQKHAGYSSIETAEVGQGNINFREVIFLNELNQTHPTIKNDKQKTLKASGLSKDEVAYWDNNILISKPNPIKCLGCHSVSSDGNNKFTRYIWDSYPVWPTAFGSRDDSIIEPPATMHRYVEEDKFSSVTEISIQELANYDYIPSTPSLSPAQGPFLSPPLSNLPNYASDFLTFKKYKKSHPRYKYLTSTNDAIPYHAATHLFLPNLKPGEKFVLGTSNIKYGGSIKPFPNISSGHRVFGNMPNTRLSLLINENLSEIYSARIVESLQGNTSKEQLGEIICNYTKIDHFGNLDSIPFSLNLNRTEADFNAGSSFHLRDYTVYKTLVAMGLIPKSEISNSLTDSYSTIIQANINFLNHIRPQVFGHNLVQREFCEPYE